MAKYCRKCGLKVNDDALFCKKCGTKFNTISAPEAKAEPGEKTTSGMKFCPECGKQIRESASFCRYCGSPTNHAIHPDPKEPAPGGEKSDTIPKPLTSDTSPDRVSSIPAYKSSEEKTSAGVPVIGADAGKPDKKKSGNPIRLPVIAAVAAAIIAAVFIIPGILKSVKIGSVTQQPTQIPVTPRSTPNAEDPINGDDGENGKKYELLNNDEEETFDDESDIYHTGKPGIDFATGEGPGSPGYHAMDGYGVETLITYTAEEIASAPAVTVRVSAEDPVARLDGITIEFGDGCLDSETAELTVRKLPSRIDEANGFSADVWDLELSGQEEFHFPAAVTVPYGDLGGQDPYKTIMPQHYNEALGRWEYVAYDIDPENRTVTAYVDHFSPIGFFLSLLGLEEDGPDELSSRESRFLRFSVTAEQIKHSVGENRSELEGLLKDLKKIAEQADKDRSALYKKDGYLEIAFRNIGNIMDTGSLSISLADYMKYLDDIPDVEFADKLIDISLPTAKEGIKFAGGGLTVASLFLTSSEMGKRLTKDLYTKNYQDLGLTLGLFKGPDVVAGLLALNSINSLTLIPAAVVKPEILLAAGAVLLAKNLIVDNVYPVDSNFDPIREKPLSDFDIIYRNAPYNHLYWNKKTHQITAMDLGFDIEYIDRKISNQKGDPTGNPDPDSRIQVKYGGDYFYSYFTEEFLEIYQKYKKERAAFLSSRDDFLPLGKNIAGYNSWYYQGWRGLLTYINDTYKKEPEKWFPEFESYLKQMDEESFAYAWDRCVLLGKPHVDPQFTSETIIGDVLYQLKKTTLFKNFSDSCFSAAEKKNIQSWESQKTKMNRKISYRLVDKNHQDLTFNETEYAGKYIVFDANPVLYKLSDPWVADMNAPTFMTCTLNGYLMAGTPKKLLVYENEEAYKKGMIADEIKLKAIEGNNKTVTLVLERTTKKPVKQPEGVYIFEDIYWNKNTGGIGRAFEKALKDMKITVTKDGHISSPINIDYDHYSGNVHHNDTNYYHLVSELSCDYDQKENKGSCSIEGIFHNKMVSFNDDEPEGSEYRTMTLFDEGPFSGKTPKIWFMDDFTRLEIGFSCDGYYECPDKTPYHIIWEPINQNGIKRKEKIMLRFYFRNMNDR